MSLGQQLISLYFLITYMIPILSNALFKESIFSSYTIYPLTLLGLVNIIVVYSLSIMLYKIYLKSNYKISFSLNNIKKKLKFLSLNYQGYRFYISIVFFLFSIIYFLLGYSSYRYRQASMLEMNAMILLPGILIGTIGTVDLFYFLLIRAEKYVEEKIPKKTYFSTILIAISGILLVNGTGQAILVFTFFFLSLFPKKINWILFKTKYVSLHRSMLKLGAQILFMGMIITMSWNYGEAIKAVVTSKDPLQLIRHAFGSRIGKLEGANQDVSLQSLSNKNIVANTIKENNGTKLQYPYHKRFADPDNFSKWLIFHLMERTSIYYYSYLFTVNNEITSEEPIIFVPLRNMLFRLDQIFFKGTLGFARPETGSICSLNYQLLTKVVASNKSGSAPGLLASFNYVFQFPFNIVACVLYLVLIIALIDKLFSTQAKSFSLFGIMIIYFIFQIFFQSPFDFLIIFDNTLLYILLIISLVIACPRKSNASTERYKEKAGLLFSKT